MSGSVEAVLGALSVAMAGGIGAAARHLCDAAATRRWGEGQVLGILLVNVLGSFLLGMLAGAGWNHEWQRLLGVGLLGGFTTFSTAMLQMLDRDRPWGARAFVHLLSTAVLTVIAASVGLWLTVR